MKQRTRYCNRHGTNFISAFPSPGSLRDFPKFAAPWQSWLELVLGLGLENETIANLAHLSDSATNAIYRMIRNREERGDMFWGRRSAAPRSPLYLPRLLERQDQGLKWHAWPGAHVVIAISHKSQPTWLPHARVGNEGNMLTSPGDQTSHHPP